MERIRGTYSGGGMANTITGILCLGVDDPEPASPTAVFRPNGFRKGTEDGTKIR